VPIYFYRTNEEPYGCFSNFSKHGFDLDGLWWPTSEHYFQAQKFTNPSDAEAVRQAPTAREAAALGRDRGRSLRPDWEEVKDDAMRRAVLRKFEAHADIRAILLATGDEELIEDAPTDWYWGCGADRTGQNRLGQILMETRATLHRRQVADTAGNASAT
jgi:ribA/ribD-fused uncharacterized protein